MLNTKTLKTLGNEWVKGDYHRIYFDVADFYPEFHELSKTQQSKLTAVKLWFDVNTGKFVYKSFDNVDASVEMAIDAIRSAATDPEPEPKIAVPQPVETAQPPVAPEYAAKFDEARASGEAVLLHYHMEDCDDETEDCDQDSVETYALPNGTIKTERSHSW